MCRRILQIHKIVNGKTPSYLKNKLPRLRRTLYRQSSSNIFHEFKCKSLRYMSSFFPDAITSWNNVITHFGDIPSLNVLKNHILSLIRPKKKCIFGIHNPLGLRYIFQLRVGLSPLRYHKNRHNFIDTPSDICLCNQGRYQSLLIFVSFFCYCKSNLTKIQSKGPSINDVTYGVGEGGLPKS